MWCPCCRLTSGDPPHSKANWSGEKQNKIQIQIQTCARVLNYLSSTYSSGLAVILKNQFVHYDIFVGRRIENHNSRTNYLTIHDQTTLNSHAGISVFIPWRESNRRQTIITEYIISIISETRSNLLLNQNLYRNAPFFWKESLETPSNKGQI